MAHSAENWHTYDNFFPLLDFEPKPSTSKASQRSKIKKNARKSERIKTRDSYQNESFELESDEEIDGDQKSENDYDEGNEVLIFLYIL